MAKLRVTDQDWTLICDALYCYHAQEQNYVCLDFVESHGLEAAREHEKHALHAQRLIDRIAKAKGASR